MAVTKEVIKEMKRKHPLQRSPINWDNLRSIHGSATEDVSEETVEKMVKSFAKGSAGGPSGLKPQHLKDAFQGAPREVSQTPQPVQACGALPRPLHGLRGTNMTGSTAQLDS